MEVILEFASRFAAQLQSSTMSFLLGGVLIAALGTRLQIPESIYRFIVFVLLMTVGLEGGIAIREANLSEMLVPAALAATLGITIVLIGRVTLAVLPSIRTEDGIATAGLFGAVSGSTLAAAIVLLREQSVFYEPWAPALYPFMDIPALITAIVLANLYLAGQNGSGAGGVHIAEIIRESLRGPALTSLLLGLLLGLAARPDAVFAEFYDPLFRGMLSVLMLVMGMDAYERITELRRVAHWYAVYAVVAPLAHGLLAFGLGYLAHLAAGLSPGGVVLLAVIAGSSSDISGPPTLRAGIPGANPSAYVGASTGLGTPVAIAVGIPLYLGLAQAVFGA